jgi:23S rRNA (uracil1939-C5)-methyltransferase
VTWTVARLGHHGDGIADGPLYIPRALPGEVVDGTPASTPGGDRLRDVRIVTPSPHRVRAPCAHYRACGGCALQHAADGFVADWKADVVRTALAAQGLAAPIAGLHTSPPRSRRRATLAGRRTRGGALVGFHAPASDTLVPVTDCHLLAPPLAAMLPVLHALTLAGGSRSGEIAFAMTATDTGVDIAATGGKPADRVLTAALVAAAGQPGVARLTWDGDVLAVFAAPTLRIAGVPVAPPPGAFLQATADGEAALVAAVTDALGDAGPVVDLFAGLGTFTLPLARHRAVHAVEGDATLTGALATAIRQEQGLKSVTVETRDLFRNPLPPEDLNRFAAAVIDPPRAGADAQTRALAASRIGTVAMVSCNPATFARDARILTDAGFSIDRIRVVDQFRWSPHVELAARLTRRHMPRG